MRLSRGSYGVYVAVTGLRNSSMYMHHVKARPVSATCRTIFTKLSGVRVSHGRYYGSTWLFRGLRGCYVVYVAVSGSTSHPFSRKSPCLVLTGYVYVKVWPKHCFQTELLSLQAIDTGHKIGWDDAHNNWLWNILLVKKLSLLWIGIPNIHLCPGDLKTAAMPAREQLCKRITRLEKVHNCRSGRKLASQNIKVYPNGWKFSVSELWWLLLY